MGEFIPMNIERLTSQFEQVLIDEASWDSAVAVRFRSLFRPELITKTKGEVFSHKGTLSKQQFEKSKKILWLNEFAGNFFKRCPGATQKKTLSCCNYHVLNLGQQCNMNCTYCYLQSYLNVPATIVYTNIEKALTELAEMAELHPQQPFRVGTGEVIDSLSLDPLTLYSHSLIEFFKKYPQWTLEFKTKSSAVDQFLNQEHKGNVVVSWSINAAPIILNEELGTATQEERLSSARRCADRGFPVAFHIDPMIYYPDWKNGYAELVDKITSRFQPDEVHVISVGSLRFQPEQRHMMRERFGMNSWVTKAEMFPSEGDKLRYDSKLRMEMLNFTIQRFKNTSTAWKVFMCMETPENWLQSFNKVPNQIPELKEFFKPLPKVDSLNP
jgi:spore photoproduct lyase